MKPRYYTGEFPRPHPGSVLHPLDRTLPPGPVAVIGHLPRAQRHLVGGRVGLGLPQERSGFTAILPSASTQDVSPHFLATK
jgi:hypothetical protein